MKTPQSFKKKLLASLIATSLVSAGVALPTSALAASADATLRGTTTPNTQIVVREIATGLTRKTESNSKGIYVLPGLPPGTYTAQAGNGPAQKIRLSVASTITLNLQTATELAAVKVSANAINMNAIDVNTSQVGSYVSLHQIQNMPAASRNFLQFADTVPGMVFSSAGPGGATKLQAGGLADSAINVYIDGVSQKSMVLAGGIVGQTSSSGNPFPQLAIGEYRVITNNQEAEYGTLSSAAIVASTKSGTNEFKGGIFGSFNSTGMRAAMPAENAAGKKTPSTDKDYGFDFGGPIIKNKMHFFIAYEGKKFNTPAVVIPNAPEVYVSKLPASVQAQAGPANLPFLENNWFGKIDYEPTDRDRFVLETHIRNETSVSGVGGVSTQSAGLNTINYQKTADLAWEHSGYDWFNRLEATWQDAAYQPTPILLGIGNAYTAAINTNYPLNPNQTILQTGNSPLAQQNKGQRGTGIFDHFTYDGLQWHGSHVIKAGFNLQRVTLTAQDAGDSNALFYYKVSPTTGVESIPYQVQFGSPIPGLSPVSVSKNTLFDTFLQDTWTFNKHWTFDLGVRADYNRTPAYLNYVTPANVVAALNSQAPGAPAGITYAQTLAAGGININNYISNGHNRSAKWNFSPRLGASYDIDGNQKHVIFGGVGRTYNQNLYDLLQVEQTKYVLSQPTILFNTPLQPCVVNNSTCYTFNPSYLSIPALQSLVAGSFAGKEVDMMPNNLKTPYSDQFSIGMRNQIGDWDTSVAVTRVLSYDNLTGFLGNRYPNGDFWQNHSQPWSYGLPGFGNLILWGNGLNTRTTQLLLSAQKPYTEESGWGLTVAYTYTHAKWNMDNQAMNNNYSFDEEFPSDYPYISEPVAKSRLVVAGTMKGPWGIAMGARLTLATPIPAVNLACYSDPNTPSGCIPVAATPEGSHFLVGGRIWGYRDFSVQFTKNFKLYGLDAYARADIINVFNWHNYSSYVYNYGSNGLLNKYPITYDPTGTISGYPRYLKLTVGVNF
ncbi:MAG: TonB-dependent receptor [Pseudomonadota bacterium]|nr:TonB-dependent receptor [Pseudomonadota bacterium]